MCTVNRCTRVRSYLTLEDVKVDGVMMRLGRDDSGLGRVPDNHISIGAGRDAALPRVDVEDPGGGGRGGAHEPLWGHDAGVDTALPNDRHPVLDPVDAVGDLGEVIDAHGFLFRGEGAVVSAGAL